jgi:hypothetical protein
MSGTRQQIQYSLALEPVPDEQKADMRRPDEWATNHEVHIHQGPGLYLTGVRGRRSLHIANTDPSPSFRGSVPSNKSPQPFLERDSEQDGRPGNLLRGGVKVVRR